MEHLERAVIVAVSVPNATKVALPLDDREGDALLHHTLGSYHSYHSAANDGNINVAPGYWFALLWGHHLDVYCGPYWHLRAILLS